MALPPNPHRARYEQWVGRYAPELFRFAHRLAGSHVMAEDLVQETFVEAWRCIASQREPGRERAWLFQILRHRYAHHVRRSVAERHVRELPDRPEDLPAAPGRPVLDRLSDEEALQRGLDTLSPESRETLLMVFVENLTCRETSVALKIPLGTVLSRIHAARQRLRQFLRPPSSTGPAAHRSNGSHRDLPGTDPLPREVNCREA